MKVFKIGHNIWFVLHFEGNKMRALEEHDHYAGGHITCSRDKSWEETFIDTATARAYGDDYKAKVKAAAEAFITSDEKEIAI